MEIPILRTSFTHLFYLRYVNDIQNSEQKSCVWWGVFPHTQHASLSLQCTYKVFTYDKNLKAFLHNKKQQLPFSIHLLLNSVLCSNKSVKSAKGQQRNVNQPNECTWNQSACLSPHLALNQISWLPHKILHAVLFILIWQLTPTSLVM